MVETRDFVPGKPGTNQGFDLAVPVPVFKNKIWEGMLVYKNKIWEGMLVYKNKYEKGS